VTELRVELLREVLEEGVGQLLVEVSITQGQEAGVLFDYVTEKKIENFLKTFRLGRFVIV
jgi:hypothetical protein